jgi:hypothetical protein
MRFPILPPPSFLETMASTLRFWCYLAELFELSVTNAGQVSQRPYEYMLELRATVHIMGVRKVTSSCFVLLLFNDEKTTAAEYVMF